ncbi:MAG TPA: hypothetical protein VFM38_00505 [Candidatus Limnocylindrales bacterium]|nr:hypothetical protein [Candidatus Limnocylindrales bacterium]
MFHVQLYLTSGATVSAELDPPLADKLIGDLLALPNVVPRVLLQLPTRDELEDRAARLRLVAVALGELLSQEGTLQFLAQHARAVVVDRTAVAAIEVRDPDPAAPSRGQATSQTQREAAQPVG